MSNLGAAPGEGPNGGERVRADAAAEAVYWDKPDLADDLREMGDNLFPGIELCLRRSMLHSAARRIEHVEDDRDRLLAALKSCLSLVRLKFDTTDVTGAAVIEQAETALAKAEPSHE